MGNDELITSALRRFVKLGGLAGRVGVSVLGDQVLNLARSGSDREDHQRENLLRNAARIVETLGELKGAAMKVGQMLSLQDGLLPPEVAQVLRALQQETKPVPPEVIDLEIRGALDDYDELFAEKLDLLVKIRDNERVTWHGKFRAPLDDQAIYPRPQQDPLPIWVGVGGTPASIVRAARLGLRVALAIIGGDPARFRPLADLYRRTLEDSGYDPEELPLAVHGLGHIAETNEQAADDVYASFTATMNRIGRERGWSPMTREQFDWMRSPDGSLVLGDAETVAAKILRWKEILGIGRFMLHTAGAVPHHKALASIEMLGTEVSPIVRASRG